MRFRIFVADDDHHYSRMISYHLDKNPEYEITVFSNGNDLLEKLDDEPHLIVLDIMMPGIGGIDALKTIKRRFPDMPVIMMSAQGVVDTAVEAMKAGAYDYITKGRDDLNKLSIVAKNALEKVSMTRELESLRDELSAQYNIEGLIGDSPAMQAAYRLIHKTLRGDLTVAIQGESGTGKELVAKAIHYNSSRKHGPFVVVNCAAIPRELMESEFFGHEKGSFTGAHARKIGKFEQADGGTIFLDEIGELNLDLQAKLLRALQNFEITRVGGNDTIRFDARVISATNRDLIPMIRKGDFREDLYYRLCQFPIQLPPLRERDQDILLLAHNFLTSYVNTHPDFKGKRLSSEARKAILNYPWPGNVRELKSAIERAILIADGEELTVEDLMLHERTMIAPWADRGAASSGAAPESRSRPKTQHHDTENGIEVHTETVAGVTLGHNGTDIVPLETLKQMAVERAYRICDGNVDKAAVELGIGRATMYRLLKKYDLIG
jgi:DNA-binding NtrC family response regulator